MSHKAFVPLRFIRRALARINGRGEAASSDADRQAAADDASRHLGSFDIHIPDMPETLERENGSGRRRHRGHRFG
jgi:hypothetical protein